MAAGEINLYDCNGGFVCGGKYRGIKERNKAIDKWRKMYGGRFLNCYIQIYPYTNGSLTKTNGENQNRPFHYNKIS